jgi:hypothetical protein
MRGADDGPAGSASQFDQELSMPGQDPEFGPGSTQLENQRPEKMVQPMAFPGRTPQAAPAAGVLPGFGG